MKKIKVLFNGSCWPTNIGNAFVNLGTIYSLSSALKQNGRVFHAGGMSSYLFNARGKLLNSLPFGEIIDCDYMVNAGMTMCYEHLVVNVPIYQQYIKRGVKIIFLGAGAGQYTDYEVEIVRKAMKKFPIYGLISRDRYTFEKYGDLAQHSYDGIDSAFFIADYFQSMRLNLPSFDVMCFDHFNEPYVDHKGRFVIRTHHSCWPPCLKSKYFKYPYTLISDLPSDYLNLYSQAKVVYSDRVHACIPALAFGNKAILFGKTPRIKMFDRLGISEISEEPINLNMTELLREKNSQIEFIKSILL
jgi:hypothetical protein